MQLTLLETLLFAVATSSIDISTCCHEILGVLKRSGENDERLTGGKLLEAMSGRGKFKTTLTDVKSLPSETVQKVIVFMLLKGYLK